MLYDSAEEQRMCNNLQLLLTNEVMKELLWKECDNDYFINNELSKYFVVAVFQEKPIIIIEYYVINTCYNSWSSDEFSIQPFTKKLNLE